MAFGTPSPSFSHQGPSSSSSTLSPLAPPFTVDRGRPRPNTSLDYSNPPPATDHRHFAGPASFRPGSASPVQRTYSSGFAQAEPFYPQYGPGLAAGAGVTSSVDLDADCYEVRSDLARTGRVEGPWNGPFDEGGGWGSDVGKGSSSWVDRKGKGFNGGSSPWVVCRENGDSQTSSWVEPSSTRFASNYFGTFGQDGVSSENFLSYENSWCGNNVEHFVKKGHFESGCKEWIDDKPSVHVHRPATVPRPSATSALSPSVVNISFPCSSGPITSMDVSSSYPYDCLTAQPGLGQNRQGDFYQDANFCSPGQVFPPVTSRTNALVYKSTQKNPYLHVGLLDGFNSNDHHRAHTSSKVIGIGISPKIEIKQCPSDKSKKSNDMNKTDTILGLFEKEKPLKEKSVSGLKLGTDDLGNFSITKPDSKVTNINVQTNAECDYSNPISSEESDHLNFGVDSPCWKGVSASGYTPFHIDNTPLVSICTGNEKLEDFNNKGSNGLTATVEKKHMLSDGLEFKNEVLLPNDLESSSPSKEFEVLSTEDGSDSAGLKLPSGNKYSTPDIFSRYPVQDDSFDFHSTIDGKISNSFLYGDCVSDKIMEASEASCAKETLHESSDAHFLVRSLYDLSKFLSSYCCESNILKKDGYDLLLMAIDNIDACASKWVGLHGCQTKSSFLHGKRSGSFEVSCLHDSFSNQINGKLTNDSSEKLHSFRSDVNYDKFDGSHMDPKRNNGIAEIIEKTMKKIFCTENPETNLYKIRWIEAEAALCSARCELYLSRMKVGVENCKQLPIDSQVSAEADQETRGAHMPFVNSVHELGGENEVVPESKESLFKNTHASGDDDIHSVISEKPQNLFPSSVTSNFEDADVSVMGRFKLLKDRIDKVDSKVQQNLQDSMAAGTGLNAKGSPLGPPLDGELNAGMHFQPSLAASTSARNPWRLQSLDTEDGNAEVRSGYSVQYFGSNYHKASFDEQYLGTSYNNEITPHTSISVEHGGAGEFHFDVGNRTIFQTYVPNDRQMKGYFASKYDSNSCDWEHVQKEELRW